MHNSDVPSFSFLCFTFIFQDSHFNHAFKDHVSADSRQFQSTAFDP